MVPRTIAQGSSTRAATDEHPDAVAVDPEPVQRGVLGRIRRPRRPGRARNASPPPAAEVHGSTTTPSARPSSASAVNAEHRDCGHDLGVLGGDADPERRRAEAERSGDLRGDQPARRERRAPARPRGGVPPSSARNDSSRRRTPSQPALLGADHVEDDQPERDGGERLGGDPEVAAGQPLAGERGRDGQPDQHRGAAADAEPRPGHGQEDHGGDEQAGRAEPEQDLGHRGGAEAGGRRGGAGGVGRGGNERRTRVRGAEAGAGGAGGSQ